MISVIIVGAGDRGMIYAQRALERPGRYRIVGVVERDPARLRAAGERLALPADRLFSSVDALCRRERLADAAFNCTMDAGHCETSLPLLEKGYHLLLEKPIAPNREDARRIRARAEEHGRHVMVCHVLRYAPFYRRIKELVAEGAIGRVTALQMAEQLSYYHQSVSYLRGRYADPAVCGSGLLLSKCVHDIDIMAWLMGDAAPESVYSEGSRSIFLAENAPAGADGRCLPDCPHVESCPFSAKRLYVDFPQRWRNRVRNDMGLAKDAPDAELLAALSRADEPYGRCVYGLPTALVDHQSVMVRFKGGAIGSFSLNGSASVSERTIRVTGTKGEIEGRFEEHRLTVRQIAPSAAGGCTVRIEALNDMPEGDAHGGGDGLILDDFERLLTGQDTSICLTSLAASVTGHEIVYAAEESRQTGNVIRFAGVG